MRDEETWVDYLTQQLSSNAAHIILGIGDDAAVLSASSENIVWTVDTSVEGVHFTQDFADWSTIAKRAFHAAASDIAAMGAQPTAALISLILPNGFDNSSLRMMVDGLSKASVELSTPIVGGNTSQGCELSITTTILGSTIDNKWIKRSGAQIGDLIYITGAPGDRALGLEIIQRYHEINDELKKHADMLAEAWRNPQARIEEGIALRKIATSAIDLSDGLICDLNRILKASNVGAILDHSMIPKHAYFDKIAHCLNLDLNAILLGGGEAYELIFTLPKNTQPSFLSYPIGQITKEKNIYVRKPDGDLESIPLLGYDHFKKASL